MRRLRLAEAPDLTWDIRGNVMDDARAIGTQTYTTTYDHDEVSAVSEMVYPSGHIVTYVRDVEGRITSVTTREDALATLVTLASNIAYLPMSAIVQSLDYGNGLDLVNTFTQDYELTALTVKELRGHNT